MKIKNLLFILILIISVISVYAKDLKGNIDNIDIKNNKLTIIVNNKSNIYTVNSSTKLMRGLIGTDLLEVNLISLSAGDAIEFSVNENNVIQKGNVTFNIIRGTIKTIDKYNLTLTDKTKLIISEKASISIENGSSGKISDLQPGHTFVARTNPNTGIIWTLVVAGKENISDTKNQEPKQEKPTTPEVNQPKDTVVVNTNETKDIKNATTFVENVNKDISINSMVISAPSNFISGDMILVQVEGTPHCGVSSDIQYVANTKVKLTEDKPGLYTGFITVPEKNLNNAKILAYMSLNGKNISKVCDTVLTVKNNKGSLKNIIVKEVEKKENIAQTTEENIKKEPATDENKEAVKNENVEPSTEEAKNIEKKEAEQNTDSKENIDKNTDKNSIINPLKEVATIKIEDIKIVTPTNGSTVKDIAVSGIAIPNTTINVRTIYTNDKYGVLSINGVLNEETIVVNSDGVFNYGPIELKNFFATSGLIYYIELQYTEQPNQTPKTIKVIRE